MFTRLIALVTRRPGRVLATALVFTAMAGVIGGPLPSLLHAGRDFDDPASQSARARQAIADATGVESDPGVVALTTTGQAPAVARLLAADPAVARVTPPVPVRTGAYVGAYLHSDAGVSDVKRIERTFAHQPGVRLGGSAVVNEVVTAQVTSDLGRAELIAFPLVALLSFFLFRGLVAALLPLAVGGTTIVTTLMTLRVVDQFTTLSIFAINLVTGLGLGLAIDYALLLVTRFREELVVDDDRRAATARALSTAGRTIAWSALTVSVALASLMVFPQRFLFSMGIAGLIVPLVSVVVTLVVLGPLLAILGPRINMLAPPRGKPRPEEAGFWYRLSRTIANRPIPFATVGAVLLLGLGLPFLGVRFTGVDASVLPPASAARIVAEAAPTTPVTVVATDHADAVAMAAAATRAPGVARVLPPVADGGVWRVDVIPAGATLAPATKALVTTLRDVPATGTVLVGGDTAGFLDLRASLADHLPIALAILVSGSLIVLFLFTGSVILPIKAVIMNLLTLCGALGLLVFVFQDGRLTGLLDYHSQGALELTQPVLLAAIAFGLSTDYGVFLLGRIREEHLAGHPDREAVALGLQRTGRVVTSAAILFCVAIGAFATSEIVFIKELGLGTAAAVIIDATIVRILLVPSLMALLGPANWWAPRRLRALHDRLGVDHSGRGPQWSTQGHVADA
jgi:RND superfamily putative drug exporter